MNKRISERPVSFFVHFIFYFLATTKLLINTVRIISIEFPQISSFASAELEIFKIFLISSTLILLYYFFRFSFYLDISDVPESPFSLSKFASEKPLLGYIEWFLRLGIWIVLVKGIGEYLLIFAGFMQKIFLLFGIKFTLQYFYENEYMLSRSLKDDYLFQVLLFSIFVFMIFLMRDIFILIFYKLSKTYNQNRIQHFFFPHLAGFAIYVFLLVVMYCESLRGISNQLIGFVFAILFLSNIVCICLENKSSINNIFTAYWKRVVN
jgi:hypothetical protein